MSLKPPFRDWRPALSARPQAACQHSRATAHVSVNLLCHGAVDRRSSSKSSLTYGQARAGPEGEGGGATPAVGAQAEVSSGSNPRFTEKPKRGLCRQFLTSNPAARRSAVRRRSSAAGGGLQQDLASLGYGLRRRRAGNRAVFFFLACRPGRAAVCTPPPPVLLPVSIRWSITRTV